MSTTEPVKPEGAEDQTPDVLEPPQSLQPQTPPSEYDLLTKQVADNPHDHDAWRRLVDVAESTSDIDKISATYDALLKQLDRKSTRLNSSHYGLSRMTSSA